MLGDISAIATLVLFVMYFIGRIITIVSERSIVCDEIHVTNIEETGGKYNIVEWFSLTEEAENCCASYVLLTSRQLIRSGRIVERLRDESMHVTGEKTIHEFGIVNIGNSVLIHVDLPEILEKYRLEYITHDYKRVSLTLADNLKNGVLAECAYAQNTWKSFFYYLLK